MFKTHIINSITNEEPPPAYSPRVNLEQNLITSLQSQIASLKLENVRLNSENSDLNKEIDKAYAKNDHLSVIYTNKSSEYNRLVAKYKILSEELVTKTDRISELDKRKYELTHTIFNMSKEIEELKSKLIITNFVVSEI
jgi:predicted  nucleic acid-binding Zn-ribbon protein